MRRLIAASLAATALTFAVSSGSALCDPTDPTVHQIYEAAESGHLDEAQQMMNQVLQDHPGSGKAHYVQAELYAREGGLGRTRRAQRAEQISRASQGESSVGSVLSNPSWVWACERQGAALRDEPGRRQAPLPVDHGGDSRPGRRRSWMLFRRRNTYVQSTAGSPERRPGRLRPRRSGRIRRAGARWAAVIGSSIAGGLAGGLAAGAGIVAGEELAHHFLDGGRLARRRGAAGGRRRVDQRRSEQRHGRRRLRRQRSGLWDDVAAAFGAGGDDWT